MAPHGKGINWTKLVRQAASSDGFQRAQAVTRAHAIAENAMGVCHPRTSGKWTPLGSRVYEAGLVNEPSFPKNLSAAIKIRNDAAHASIEDKVPSKPLAVRATKIFLEVYHFLRGRFVRRETAVEIAQVLLTNNSIEGVFLFGSLSRNARGGNARDIDLLILDDGSLSSDDSWYGLMTTERLFERVNLDGVRWRRAIELGWIDVVLVNGTRFDREPTFRNKIALLQPDPLFFVNIAKDLRGYDSRTKKWTVKPPAVFPRLENIGKQLDTEGLLRRRRSI